MDPCSVTVGSASLGSAPAGTVSVGTVSAGTASVETAISRPMVFGSLGPLNSSTVHIAPLPKDPVSQVAQTVYVAPKVNVALVNTNGPVTPVSIASQTSVVSSASGPVISTASKLVVPVVSLAPLVNVTSQSSGVSQSSVVSPGLAVSVDLSSTRLSVSEPSATRLHEVDGTVDPSNSPESPCISNCVLGLQAIHSFKSRNLLSHAKSTFGLPPMAYNLKPTCLAPISTTPLQVAVNPFAILAQDAADTFPPIRGNPST